MTTWMAGGIMESMDVAGNRQDVVGKEDRKAEGATLSTPVQYLKGVGPARAATFDKLGVKTVGDLLEYFPRDWIFAPGCVKIGQLRPNEAATIIGLVESIDYQQYRRQPPLEVMVSDETGVCRIVWFHGGYLPAQIQLGQPIMASGKPTLYKHHRPLTNPK